MTPAPSGARFFGRVNLFRPRAIVLARWQVHRLGDVSLGTGPSAAASYECWQTPVGPADLYDLRPELTALFRL